MSKANEIEIPEIPTLVTGVDRSASRLHGRFLIFKSLGQSWEGY